MTMEQIGDPECLTPPPPTQQWRPIMPGDLTTAIDAAVDTDPLKLHDALPAILRHCEMAEDSWDLAPHPGPRPGAPPLLTMPDGAWLPTGGIRNLIARELGEEADRGSR